MRYIETKTILSKLRTADRWFGIAYNMNLYRGCQHGCIYCDTRSDCYGIGDIAQIAVKRNALELLPAELRARRKKRATIGTGSMNDPYMPVERELRLTRRALGMIADERFPVHVITKSSLAERDADILQAQGYATAMAAGVPSFCAAAARLNQPLTGGMDAPLTIAPGSRADEVLDAPGTKVLMKTGRQLPALLDTLDAHGALSRSALVCSCGLPDETIFPDLSTARPPQDGSKAGYFATVLVKE
mgnify:CR=1 FL=1